MLEAILKEIEIKSATESISYDTIYFGGGTPSILEPEEIDAILEKIFSHYRITDHVEITLEANPEDIHEKNLKSWKKAGINRLSMGVQSLNNNALQKMNRVHDSQNAINAVREIRKAGFSNLNLDIIFGLPFLSQENYEEDVKGIIGLEPEHISAYHLTIEEKTVFGRWSQKGKLVEIDDELALTQFQYLINELKMSGYEQYEISNFSKLNMESRHNRKYWTNASYLGFGPGAFSFNQRERTANIRNNALYVKALKVGKIPEDVVSSGKYELANDYIIASLRTKEGTNLEYMTGAFNIKLGELKYVELVRLKDAGFLRFDDRTIVLSEKGRLIADEIAEKLMVLN